MTRTLALAEMPEIDHRVRQTFQGVMQLTNPFKAQQGDVTDLCFQTLKPFSGKDPGAIATDL